MQFLRLHYIFNTIINLINMNLQLSVSVCNPERNFSKKFKIFDKYEFAAVRECVQPATQIINFSRNFKI